MIRNLGRLVWRQTRDMNVYNYPIAILYEVRTSEGNMWLKYCKKTELWSVDKSGPGDIVELLTAELPSPLRMPRDTKSCCR